MESGRRRESDKFGELAVPIQRTTDEIAAGGEVHTRATATAVFGIGVISTPISFNVGGQRFTTSTATILKHPDSTLARLIKSSPAATIGRPEWESHFPYVKDETGAVLIDRDPKHFRLILNYYRDGDQCVIPPYWRMCPGSEGYKKTPNEAGVEFEELVTEVRYYQLWDLLKLVTTDPAIHCQLCNRRVRTSAKGTVVPKLRHSMLAGYEMRQIFPHQFNLRSSATDASAYLHTFALNM